MRKLKLLLLLVLAAGFFLTMGCKKGDTGPAGPAGPDSVRYSGWITLQMTAVGLDNNNDTIWQESIPAPAITSTVLAKGSVVGYILFPDFITGDSSIVNASGLLQEYYNVGSIDLVSDGLDASGAQYRYVIVPGKIAATSASGELRTYTAPELSKMDYKTVSGILKIPAH